MNYTATPPAYRHWTIYLGLFLSALCLFIALRIEWFNAHSSTLKLPRSADSGKWRYTSDLSIERMAEDIYRHRHNLDVEIELTASQRVEINSSSERMKQRRDLDSKYYGFIGSFGLLQHLLVPSLFFLSIYTGSTAPRRNLIAFLFALISAFCGLLMLYRGYFSALGW
jgi:hypothetical protein